MVTTFATRPAPSKRSSSSPPWIVTPWLLQQLVEEAPGRGAEAAFEHDVLLHHDRAALAEHRQRGGDLAADVGAADQHDLLCIGDTSADRVGVAERAQVVDLLEVAALDVQAPHVGAGREQRLAELDLFLGRELRDTRRGVERGDAGARQQLDLLLGPPGVGPEEGLAALLDTAQVALGAVRPVVWRVGLAADEQHRAVGALLAQPARAVRAREPSSDQQVVHLA